MPESYHLNISEELRKKFEAAVIAQVTDAYDGAKDRDQMLVAYSNMVEGMTPIFTSARYDGACELQYPTVKKAFFTLMGQLIQQFKRELKVTCTAVSPDDEESAEAQEHFMTAKDHECSVTSALAEVASQAIQFPVGIAYVGYEENVKTVREERFISTNTGEEVEDGMQREEEQYAPVVRRVPKTIFKGVKVRAVHTQDFYTYADDAISEQTCYGCGERMMLTENDLLLGIKRNGYDEDSVMDLIDRGPCRLKRQDDNTVTNDDLGVEEPDNPKDQSYEVYDWYFQTPIIRTGKKLDTPDYLIGDELHAVVCPAANIVLRMDYSDYQDARPYVPFYIWPRTGYFYGYCVPGILETIQSESDAISRQFIDALNMATTPAFKELDGSAELNSGFELFPGARYRCRVGLNEIEPFDMPQPNPENLQVLQSLNSLADEIIQGSTLSLQQKVRKNKEVQASQQLAASHFDAFYFHFSGSSREGSGIIELMKRIIMLYADNMDDDGEEFLDEDDHATKITKQQLKGRFIYRAAGNGSSADPEIKLQHALEAKQIGDEYTQIEMQLLQAGQGQVTPQLVRAWKTRRAILIDLNIPRVEDYIGPMPQVQQGRQQVAPLIQNLQPQGGNGNGQNGLQQPSPMAAFGAES